MYRDVKFRQLPKWLVFSLFLLGLATLPAFAQIDRGVIVGTVLDTSGAVVQQANVIVTNQATGVAVTAPVNAIGDYQVLALIPGTYSVKVSARGFETAVRDGIVLHVQDRLSLNFTLKVGAVTEQVEVSGAEPLLQTQTADVGDVVDSQKVNDLPLNGRRYADLALLEPGVNKFYAANNPAPDRFSANGNLELQNNFLLNGIDNNSWSENLQEFSVQVVQPPPDAVEEFRVQTRTYSSEFGNSAGAVINATVKSGTNGYHGNLFEYLRNAKLDANSWINKHTSPIVPRGGFTQNQFGGTFGGPIIKDKTFFFGDFERFTSRQSTSITSTVPTPLMKAGNFTELPFALTPSTVPGQAGCYVGNVIQAGCLDPVAGTLMTLLPDPNISSLVAVQGTPGSWTGQPNYLFSTSVPDDVYSLDGKIDHNLNQKNRMFGSYSYRHLSRQDPPWTANGAIGSGNFATQYRIHDQSWALGWTRNLSNSLLNDARFGFNRDYAHSDPIGVTLGTSRAQSLIGLTGIPNGPGSGGLPPIEINGLTRIGTSPWRPQYQISQAWNIVENLSWLKGSHSFKFGYQYLKRSDNFLDLRAPQGELQTNGIYTAGGANGLPDFLLGDVDGVHFTTPLVVHYFQPGHSFYAMDTWKTTQKLTLTYGLRYELFAPIRDRNNRTTNFTPANGGGIVTAASNASGWYDRALIHPDLNDFAPRLGFAYQMTDRVVLRGGYGVFYQHSNRIGSESLLQLNPPFLLDEQLNQSGANTVFQLKNGFPLSTITGSGFNLTNIQLRAQDPNQRSGYVEQTSFGTEYQVSSDTVLAATYVGNWGRKMNRLRDANMPRVTAFDNGCPVLQYPYANLNTISNIDTFTSSGCQSTGQHAFLELATNDGNTDYNSLELSLRKRMSKGLTYSLGYTFSHGLADFGDNLTDPDGALPQNSYNYAAEKSNSTLDIRSRFVGSFLWVLPLGQGQHFLSRPGVLNRVVGGWQLNGIVTLQTGSPYSVTAANDGLLGFTHVVYANCIGDPFAGATTNPDLYTTTGFLINPAAFSQPGSGQFGTCRPRMFHGPGIRMLDLSIFKDFRFTEHSYLQFRTEFFNAFNHPNFANPSANISSPGSFGKVSNTLAPILGTDSGGPGDPREIQFALKLFF
ncbi:MAG: TonB-dependent receptor [Acidobacteria bacterium]|nr:TonB-dependent receptor [Acidobacteriota bacterium]